MTDWIVRRWARYGQDRLYAETPGGTALGYVDLISGRLHSDDQANLPLLEKAISDHFESRKSVVPPTAVPANVSTSAPAPSLVPVSPTWDDLSSVRAGAAARERALVEREAQGWFRHVFARLVDAKTDERAWRIGADGEEAVAAQLNTLGERWRVLHAVRVGERGADIDHVLIGPAGVFTLNTKHHPGGSIWVGGETFMVNGRRVPYIRSSRYEARRTSRLLTEHSGFPVPVRGVIVVVGARRGFTVKNPPADGAVVVVPRTRIRRFVQSLPPRLTAREIDTIYDVARRSTTWQR